MNQLNYNDQLTKWLKMEIVANRVVHWASLLYPVPKKSWKWRLWGDYQRFNAITMSDWFPITNVPYKIWSAHIIMHQLPRKIFKSRSYTNSSVCLFQWSGTQRYIHMVLRGLNFRLYTSMRFLVASTDMGEHKNHLNLLLRGSPNWISRSMQVNATLVRSKWNMPLALFKYSSNRQMSDT